MHSNCNYWHCFDFSYNFILIFDISYYLAAMLAFNAYFYVLSYPTCLLNSSASFSLLRYFSFNFSIWVICSEDILFSCYRNLFFSSFYFLLSSNIFSKFHIFCWTCTFSLPFCSNNSLMLICYSYCFLSWDYNYAICTSLRVVIYWICVIWDYLLDIIFFSY